MPVDSYLIRCSCARLRCFILAMAKYLVLIAVRVDVYFAFSNAIAAIIAIVSEEAMNVATCARSDCKARWLA